MNTAWLLMAQYDKAIIPLEDVRRDHFSHLNIEMFRRKLARGEIKLPIIRAEASTKAHQGVHIDDLAAYLDTARDQARKELEQITKGVAA